MALTPAMTTEGMRVAGVALRREHGHALFLKEIRCQDCHLSMVQVKAGVAWREKSGVDRMVTFGWLYHAGNMKYFDSDDEAREWQDQELALFARRAHRRLGRGFVLADETELQPIYVTWMVGAPYTLIEAVLDYDPEREAVVVFEDEDEDDAIIVSCVRIQSRH
jgi:hypothetical protein